MRTCALLLAVIIAAAAFGGAQAARSRSFWRPLLLRPPPTPPAIAGTCQAAHDADKRVSVTFCTKIFALLGPYGTTVRGLAETAASMGAGHADTAQTTIEKVLNQRGGDEPKLRRALERCDRLYGSASAALLAARKAIAEQRYGDVGRSLAGVPELGQQCDSEYAGAVAGSDSPTRFLAFSDANEQFTYLTIAITSLIK